MARFGRRQMHGNTLLAASTDRVCLNVMCIKWLEDVVSYPCTCSVKPCVVILYTGILTESFPLQATQNSPVDALKGHAKSASCQGPLARTCVGSGVCAAAAAALPQLPHGRSFGRAPAVPTTCQGIVEKLQAAPKAHAEGRVSIHVASRAHAQLRQDQGQQSHSCRCIRRALQPVQPMR